MEEFIKTRAFPWILAGLAAIILVSSLESFIEIRKVKKLMKDHSIKLNPLVELLEFLPTEKKKADPFQDNKSMDESLVQEAEKVEAKGEPKAAEIKP